MANVPAVVSRLLDDGAGGLAGVPVHIDVRQLFCPARLLDDDELGPPTSLTQLMDVLGRARREAEGKLADGDMDAIGRLALAVERHDDLVSAVLLATYGAPFVRRLVLGEVVMTDERLAPWAEAMAMLHGQGLVARRDLGPDGDDIGDLLLGLEGCFLLAADVYAVHGVTQPSTVIGPFPVPGIPGLMQDSGSTKAAVARVVLAAVPTRSSQRESGLEVLQFIISERLRLVRRGAPFTADEATILGTNLPFASLDELQASPTELSQHIRTQQLLLDLDDLFVGLILGSPEASLPAYYALLEERLFTAGAPIADGDELLASMEAIRVERLLRTTLPPVSSVPGGYYEDKVVVVLTSPTADAKIYFTLDGSQPTIASPQAQADGLTVSAADESILRAFAVAPDLQPSSELELIFLIKSSDADYTALIVSIACACVLALLVSAIVTYMMRRHQLPLLKPEEVEVGDVIGVGSRSIVFAGTYRGAEVAVKEFVDPDRMEEVLRSQKPDNHAFDMRPSTLNSGSTSTHSLQLASSGMLSSRSSNTMVTVSSSRATRDRDAVVHKQLLREFSREVRMLNRIRHPNIVALIGAFDTNERRGIVLELMHRGSLGDVLANPTQILGWKKRVHMALDAARGLAYLHAQSPPILHHDVKSHNILVDERNHCSLSDFGASVDVGGERIDIGTVPWMAPEALRRRAYTTACDVFSFGVVLWELAARQDPTASRTAQQIADDTLSGNRLPIDNENWPVELCTLISECWKHNPKRRPSIADVVQRLGSILADLPDELRGREPNTVVAGSAVLGRAVMKDMQRSLLDGVLPHAFLDPAVTVVFLDIVSFAKISSKLDAADVADLLQRVFGLFDQIAAEFGCLHFQTIGHTYVALAHEATRPAASVAGTPWKPEQSACMFAMAAVERAARLPILSNGRLPPVGHTAISLRCGIASGSVGFQLVSFDRLEILGDTVNLASRLESLGVGGRVQVSEALFHIVADAFPNSRPSSIKIKGKGRMRTVLLGTSDATPPLNRMLDADLRTHRVSEDDSEQAVYPGASDAALDNIPGTADFC